MDYGDYVIEVMVAGYRFKARIRRRDGDPFSINGSAHPNMQKFSAETSFTYLTDEAAISEAKAIIDRCGVVADPK